MHSSSPVFSPHGSIVPSLQPPSLALRDSASVLAPLLAHLPSITSGVLAGLLVVLRTISYSQFIFADKLSRYSTIGLSCMLFQGLICQIIYIFRAKLRGMIAGSSSTASTFLAAIAASLAASTSLTEGDLLQAVLFTLVISGLLSGFFLFVLGKLHFGRFLLYFPYPVARGFFTAVGLSMILGGLNMSVGFNIHATDESMRKLFSPNSVSQIIVAVLVCVSSKLVRWKFRSPLVFPIFLAASLCLFYIVIFSWSQSLTSARSTNWIFPSSSADSTWFYEFWISLNVFGYSWQRIGPAIADRLADVFILAILIVLDMSLNLPALQEMDSNDKGLDLNYELSLAGQTCMIGSALGGGGISYLTLSPTKVNWEAGGSSSNVSSISAAVFCFISLIFGPNLVSVLPPAFVGGLLAYAGLAYVVEGVWDSRLILTPFEYSITVLIVALSFMLGLIEAVGVGFGCACLLFVIKYSSSPFARFRPSIESHYRSHHLRSYKQSQFIDKNSNLVNLLRFHGFLYFGSVENIENEIRKCLFSTSLRVLIFDFQRVNGIDASALETLGRIKRIAMRKQIQLIFCNLHAESRKLHSSSMSSNDGIDGIGGGFLSALHPSAASRSCYRWLIPPKFEKLPALLFRQLDRAGLLVGVRVFPDLNSAREWCEDSVILPLMNKPPIGIEINPHEPNLKQREELEYSKSIHDDPWLSADDDDSPPIHDRQESRFMLSKPEASARSIFPLLSPSNSPSLTAVSAFSHSGMSKSAQLMDWVNRETPSIVLAPGEVLSQNDINRVISQNFNGNNSGYSNLSSNNRRESFITHTSDLVFIESGSILLSAANSVPFDPDFTVLKEVSQSLKRRKIVTRVDEKECEELEIEEISSKNGREIKLAIPLNDNGNIDSPANSEAGGESAPLTPHGSAHVRSTLPSKPIHVRSISTPRGIQNEKFRFDHPIEVPKPVNPKPISSKRFSVQSKAQQSNEFDSSRYSISLCSFEVGAFFHFSSNAVGGRKSDNLQQLAAPALLITASSQSILRIIPRTALRELEFHHPDIALQLYRRVLYFAARRIEIAVEQILEQQDV